MEKSIWLGRWVRVTRSKPFPEITDFRKVSNFEIMTDNRKHLTIITRLLMCSLNQGDHFLQVEVCVALYHLRVDCLESIVDVMRVVLKLATQLCTSEYTGNNIQCHDRTTNIHLLVDAPSHCRVNSSGITP